MSREHSLPDGVDLPKLRGLCADLTGGGEYAQSFGANMTGAVRRGYMRDQEKQQLAKWCKVRNGDYRSQELARQISVIWFGRVLERGD